MLNDEQYFINEFEKLINNRRGVYGDDTSFDFATVPVLPFEFKVAHSDNNWGFVNGIGYEPFAPLNETYVEILKGSTFEHRVSYNGEWVKDIKGEIQVDEVHVPKGCVAIRSSKKLIIRKVDDNGNIIRIPNDYGVIDFEEDEYGNPCAYKYIIPKSCVYSTNPLALCVAKNTHGNVYYGKALRMQNGEEIFLYVIPYSKSSESEGTNKRIISIKVGCTDAEHAFDKEIAAICNFWRGMSVNLPNISLTSFVEAHTRYFDIVKTSKNDKIRARGALRLPKCRIMLRCMYNNEVMTGYCDMDGTRMLFNFFTRDENLRKFYWDFSKVPPKLLHDVKIMQICLERIGVNDSQEHRWLTNYNNKFNMLRQSGQCNMCRTNTNFATLACTGCNMCSNEERVYYAIFNDVANQTKNDIRWFSSVIFNPSITSVQIQNKRGANLAARNLDGVGIGEYNPISLKSLSEEK